VELEDSLTNEPSFYQKKSERREGVVNKIFGFVANGRDGHSLWKLVGGGSRNWREEFETETGWGSEE